MVEAMGIPDVIRELVKRYGSLNAASRKADIPLTTLFRLYKGEHEEAQLRTLRKIALALDRPLDELIRELEGMPATRQRDSA